MNTYWNGEIADCRRVIVRVGNSPFHAWWQTQWAGQLRRAVQVLDAGGKSRCFLDNEDGRAWEKVTIYRGWINPYCPFLPDDSEVVALQDDAA